MRIGLLISIILLSASLSAAQDTVPATELADENGQFIEIDGVELYYIEAGPADGPPVILIHGFGGSTFTWRETVPALADAGYRTLAYDRPPYGLAEKRADIELSGSAYVAQLAGLMDALEIDTATLVGHSAGADVIARFAVAHPDRVAGLIFVAGAVGGGRDTSSADAVEDDGGSPLGDLQTFGEALDPESPLAQQLVRRFLTEDQFLGILTSAYHPSFEVTDEINDGYARVLRVEGWEIGFLALVATGETSAAPIDLDALSAIDVPVMLIWGEADSWVPISRGEALLEIFPAAEWVTFPDVGHMPMEEDVEAFNATLITFLADAE